VVLVNRHLRAKRTTTYALYPLAAAQAAAHRERLTLVAAAAGSGNSGHRSQARAAATLAAAAKGDGSKFGVRDEDVLAAARRQRDGANPRNWTVHQVGAWLQDALSSSGGGSGGGEPAEDAPEVSATRSSRWGDEKGREEEKDGDARADGRENRDLRGALGSFTRASGDGSGGWASAVRLLFLKHKVDGTVLMQLEDADLEHTFGVNHRLHRRKVLCAIDDLRTQEFEARVAASGGGVSNSGAGAGALDEFIAALDGDRIRLVSRLKVAFDRVDANGSGTVSVFDVKAALEALGKLTRACSRPKTQTRASPTPTTRRPAAGSTQGSPGRTTPQSATRATAT
jgi:hypothetical protein